MSTPFRPELSKKNPFYISKHRYYELRHMCLQYPEWKRALKEIDGYKKSFIFADTKKRSEEADPTGVTVEQRDLYSQKIRMVEWACKEADPTIQKYLLIGVTEGVRYEFLRSRYNIPCSRDYYFEQYHKLFKILDSRKNHSL